MTQTTIHLSRNTHYTVCFKVPVRANPNWDDLSETWEDERLIGFILQNTNLYPWTDFYTVCESCYEMASTDIKMLILQAKEDAANFRRTTPKECEGHMTDIPYETIYCDGTCRQK